MNGESYSWYDLKYSIAEFMIPKLEEYKLNFEERGRSIPTWVSEEKIDYSTEITDAQINMLRAEWLQQLDQMIFAFRMISNYKTGEDDNIPYDEALIQKGVELFAKHYQHLWD